MEDRKIPYSELGEAWQKGLKPSDVIVFPDGHEIDFGTINALRLKAANEIKAVMALREKGEELLANTLAEHKIRSELSSRWRRGLVLFL